MRVLGGELPENDERADYLRATLSPADGAGRHPPAGPGQLPDGPARQGGLLVIREPYAPAAPAGSDCVILKLGL